MKSATWLKNRVSRLITSGDRAEAVPYLEKLLTLRDAGPYDRCYAHSMLGEIYLHDGRHRLAQEHLKASMDVGGENIRGLLLLGQAYCGDGKLRRGRRVLEAARRLDPKDEAVELSLGLCECMLGEFGAAAKAYERCLTINPGRAEAYIGLAQSFAGMGDMDAARGGLLKGKEKLPLSLTLRLAIKELKKLEKARDFCEWALEQNFYLTGFQDKGNNLMPVTLAQSAMVELRFPPWAINNAIKLWRDFTRVSREKANNPGPWAAAIVYTMARFLGRKDITQAVLASQFGCSNSKVSLNFRRIVYSLKISANDKRYAAPEMKQ